MTTKAEYVTNSLKSAIKSARYSDFTTDFDAHPDTGDLFRFTEVNAVKRAMRNLIFTDKYERLFDPNKGCGVRALLFENITTEVLIAIKDTVMNTIRTYEPRVALEEVKVSASPDDNYVNILIAFKVINIPETQFFSITVDRAR